MTGALDLTLAEASLVAASALAGGIVRGFTGFGSALVIAPVLGLAVGPVAAVPAIILVLFVTTLQLLPGAVGEADLRRVTAMGLAGCLGVPLGVHLLVTLDQELVRRFISAFVAAFALAMLSGWRYRRTPSLLAAVGAGGAGGVLTGAASVGGPPVIAFLLAGPDRAAANRAAIILYFGFTQAVAIALYGWQGVITPRVLWLCALLLPAQVIGVWLGARLFPLAGEALFRRLSLGVLLAVGLATLLA